MMKFEDIRVGTVIRLREDEDKVPMAGCRIIKRGLYRVKEVRPSYSSHSGKKEWDTVAEVEKISKAGKPIAKYIWCYYFVYFMEHGELVDNTPSLP